MCSPFQPTTFVGNRRSGNAAEEHGLSTSMAISAGSGRLNRSRILRVPQNQLSYRHLKRKFLPSNCRSLVESVGARAMWERPRSLGHAGPSHISQTKTHRRIFCSHRPAGGRKQAKLNAHAPTAHPPPPRLRRGRQSRGYSIRGHASTGAMQRLFNLYLGKPSLLVQIFSLRYLCGLNCACAWRRPSAAALNSGLSCSAASNSGMLSRGLPDARRAHPRLAWAGAALLGFNRSVS
jgi:hypothetical protein